MCYFCYRLINNRMFTVWFDSFVAHWISTIQDNCIYNCANMELLCKEKVSLLDVWIRQKSICVNDTDGLLACFVRCRDNIRIMYDKESKNGGSIKNYAQKGMQNLSGRSQPAKETSSSEVSVCFIFIYFLLLHWRNPATWRSRAQTSMRAELPSGKQPTTLVRRRISRLRRSMTLLVRMRVQCSLGKW